MLHGILLGLMALGLIPLTLAWIAMRRTSLAHAIGWAGVAWLVWTAAFLFGEPNRPGLEPWKYCALCLTACAGIAVYGARRPHVAAWDLVVLGLFAVMSWPLVETLLIGTHPADTTRILFMSTTIAVGILNYLPTRQAPTAILLLLVCGGQVALTYLPQMGSSIGMTDWLSFALTFIPWIGWACVRRDANTRSILSRRWLTFRDCWGLVWGHRVRDQFNRAAENAALPIVLRWGGPVTKEEVHSHAPTETTDADRILLAILQRFDEPT